MSLRRNADEEHPTRELVRGAPPLPSLGSLPCLLGLGQQVPQTKLVEARPSTARISTYRPPAPSLPSRSPSLPHKKMYVAPKTAPVGGPPDDMECDGENCPQLSGSGGEKKHHVVYHMTDLEGSNRMYTACIQTINRLNSVAKKVNGGKCGYVTVFGGDAVDITSDSYDGEGHKVEIVEQLLNNPSEHMKMVLGNRDINKMRLHPNMDMVYPGDKTDISEYYTFEYGINEFEGIRTRTTYAFGAWPTPDTISKALKHLYNTVKNENGVPTLDMSPVDQMQGDAQSMTVDQLLDSFQNIAEATKDHIKTALSLLRLCILLDKTMGAGENQSGAKECSTCSGFLKYFAHLTPGLTVASEEMNKHIALLKKFDPTKELPNLTTSNDDLQALNSLFGHISDYEALLNKVKAWISEGGAMYNLLTKRGDLVYVEDARNYKVCCLHAGEKCYADVSEGSDAPQYEKDKSCMFRLPEDVEKSNGMIKWGRVKYTTLKQWADALNRYVRHHIKGVLDGVPDSKKWIVLLGGPGNQGPASTMDPFAEPFEKPVETDKQHVWLLGHQPNALPQIGREGKDMAVRIDTQYKRPSWCVSATTTVELANKMTAEMKVDPVEDVRNVNNVVTTQNRNDVYVKQTLDPETGLMVPNVTWSCGPMILHGKRMSRTVIGNYFAGNPKTRIVVLSPELVSTITDADDSSTPSDASACALLVGRLALPSNAVVRMSMDGNLHACVYDLGTNYAAADEDYMPPIGESGIFAHDEIKISSGKLTYHSYAFSTVSDSFVGRQLYTTEEEKFMFTLS